MALAGLFRLAELASPLIAFAFGLIFSRTTIIGLTSSILVGEVLFLAFSWHRSDSPYLDRGVNIIMGIAGWIVGRTLRYHDPLDDVGKNGLTHLPTMIANIRQCCNHSLCVWRGSICDITDEPKVHILCDLST